MNNGLILIAIALFFSLVIKACNDHNAIVRAACIQKGISEKDCGEWEIH